MRMLERVCEGLFYSSKGRFPSSTNMGTWTTAFWRIRMTFPPCGVGGPPLAAFGHHLRLVHCLVGPDVRWSVPGLGWSVWSGLWASFACVTQHWVFCAVVLRLLSVFALFRVWVPAIQQSPKLMEMVRNKPYNYFWCLKVMKRCRS